MQIYDVTWDGPITPQPSEVAAWEWLTADEIDRRLAGDPDDWCGDSLVVWRSYRAARAEP
jgi:hypothetical protein